MKAIRDFVCECGNRVTVRDHEYAKYECGNCKEVMYQDFSKKRIVVDRTLGYYNRQLGAYIESSSDVRRVMKEKGLEETDVDSVIRHNEGLKAERNRKSREKLTDTVVKAGRFLARNKGVAKRISDEIQKTGASATAKKISEVTK